MLKVNLTYFRRSGKYASEGDFSTEQTPLFRIWDIVKKMKKNRSLPGLVMRHDDYIVLVDVPEHPHRHPHLLI